MKQAQVSFIHAVERDPTCEESLFGLWIVSDRLFRQGIEADREAEAERTQEQAALALALGKLALAIALWTVAHASLAGSTRRMFKHHRATCMERRSSVFAQLGSWDKSLKDAEE